MTEACCVTGQQVLLVNVVQSYGHDACGRNFLGEIVQSAYLAKGEVGADIIAERVGQPGDLQRIGERAGAGGFFFDG